MTLAREKDASNKNRDKNGWLRVVVRKIVIAIVDVVSLRCVARFPSRYVKAEGRGRTREGNLRVRAPQTFIPPWSGLSRVLDL